MTDRSVTFGAEDTDYSYNNNRMDLLIEACKQGNIDWIRRKVCETTRPLYRQAPLDYRIVQACVAASSPSKVLEVLFQEANLKFDPDLLQDIVQDLAALCLVLEHSNDYDWHALETHFVSPSTP